MRGNAHLARVQCSDPRVTGRRTVFVNGGAQVDGSSVLYGAAYQEVGTWDAAGTNFTAAGGMWETSYRGAMGADGSLDLRIVGYGWGGTIDGLRIDETLTRGPGPILDPTIPYDFVGTIKPAPLNTIELVNDFSRPFTFPAYGKGACFNADGQFHAVGTFPTATKTFDDTYLFGQQCNASGWTVTNGLTREWRADLVGLDDNATNMAELVVSAYQSTGYGFLKGRDFALLLKWSSQLRNTVLWCERTTVPLPHTNVIMAVALTRQDPNVVITTRVLDKADPNKALFAHSYLDTPASDTSLTASELQALTGMQITGLFPDAAEPPPNVVGVCLGLFQYTNGKQPAPTAVYDNLEMRTSEIPLLGLERAVRLSWPASPSVNYAVQSAPAVQGPYTPVEDLAMPGFNQMTVPMSDPAGFFRLIPAP